MKQLLIFSFLLFLGFQATGQRVYKSEFSADTLAVSGGVRDTLTFTLGQNLPDHWAYSWQVRTSTVSGTPTGSIRLEESNCASCSDWTPRHTITLSGTVDTVIVGSSLYGYRQRLRVLSDTAAQSIRFSVNAVLKRLQ